MKFPSQPLDKYLVEHKLAKPKEVEAISAIAKEKSLNFEQAMRYFSEWSEEKAMQLLAKYYEIPFISLEDKKIPAELISLLPSLMAQTHHLVVFQRDEKGVHVATSEPGNFEIIRVLEKRFHDPVHIYVVTVSAMEDVMRLYDTSLRQALEEIIAHDISNLRSVDPENVELPIIRITDAILQYAVNNNASDIHIEPRENFVLVRYRIDGILHDVVELPKLILGPIVTRIEILSKLRIDEHFAAQDGRFDFTVDQKKIDVRVSIIPITEGEKVVMRLFTEKSRRLTLQQLGMSDEQLVVLNRGISKPHGMILSSGPTGSGKTTSMYAILQKIDSRDINISTIEDPVEYDMEGINQIQVNNRTNLSFAKGLRSILRQDPDVIMVGEIRDEDTAQIAVNAAMTGHLVLSTLHANNASTTFPRLIDFKVKPFLLSSSINLIISQRLVRRICKRCKAEIKFDKKQLEAFKKQLPSIDLLGYIKAHKVKFHRGKGCSTCNDTGYTGRIGIYELLEVDETIRSLIMREASADDIQNAAVKNGMKTMLQDGMQKVTEGITTLDEIVRVMSI